MASSYDNLTAFLAQALSDDPVCTCGGRKHQHSDDGPCYHCSECDYFKEKQN